MGVGLQPLEFTECLADSPQFRENLQRHEKELERTSQQIKRLIKEIKDVVQAAKRLGAAQQALAASMEQFEFACIGASMTEDERVISRSLHHFAHLIRTIEDERDRMLGRAHEQIIQPLEKFRKEHIGAVKEGKKKFDKKTAKFCQTQERTLSLSTKKPDNVFQEADAAMDMAERDFCQASLEYVFQLQAVQERKKFELVETLLGFVFGWWTFHHTAHDVHADAEPRVRDLQLRIQRTRSNFEETSKQTESLMKKMMEVRQMTKEEEAAEDSGVVSRAGYLFLMEKKAFGTTWSKQYCTYERNSRTLSLTPYNQINVKTGGSGESVCVCGGRGCAEPVERRFCWEAVPADRERAPLTLQALSERDRARWLRALDSPPPTPLAAPALLPAAAAAAAADACALDDAGFAFVRRLVGALEARGLEEQGLYRVAGVASRVARLVALAREPRPPPLADPLDWETRTLTSALKSYLRALPEPLLTRALHRRFIAVAKSERRSERAAGLHALVHELPPPNYDMLKLVISHLRKSRGREERQEPDVGVEPGGVLRADAAARRARDRRLHPRAQVLQRHRRDAARPLPRDIRDAAAAAGRAGRGGRGRGGRGRGRGRGAGRRGRGRGGGRAGGVRAAGPARAARAAAQRRHEDVAGVAGRRALLAAPPPAAAAVRAGRARRRALQQQLGRVGVVAQRVAAAGARGAPGRRHERLPRTRAGGARAHAVRLPGRERGRAVVRAQPDHHERGAVGRAGLAARHAQRQDGARARQLRRAAALTAP